MGNITITNNDNGSIEIAYGIYKDELLTFAGAGTVIAGTILARDTSTLNLVPYVKGGTTNGNGIPCCLATVAVEATGAGNVACRPLVSGEVNQDRLIIHADGDDSNVDAAILDELRARSIVAKPVSELNIQDNQ